MHSSKANFLIFCRSSALPLTLQSKGNEKDSVQLKFNENDFKLQPLQLFDSLKTGDGFELLQYQEADGDDDSVVIEAAVRGDRGEEDEEDKESESKCIQVLHDWYDDHFLRYWNFIDG